MNSNINNRNKKSSPHLLKSLEKLVSSLSFRSQFYFMRFTCSTIFFLYSHSTWDVSSDMTTDLTGLLTYLESDTTGTNKHRISRRISVRTTPLGLSANPTKVNIHLSFEGNVLLFALALLIIFDLYRNARIRRRRQRKAWHLLYSNFVTRVIIK